MTRISPAAVVVHRGSGPAAARPSPQPSDAPPAGPDGLCLDRTRVLEGIPNTPPDGQVGVIPGTVGGVAVAQLLGRDAVVVRFPAGSGWSVQALLDQKASLDTLALVRGKVAVGV